MKIFFLVLIVVGVTWNVWSFRNIQVARADALEKSDAAAAQDDGVLPWTLLEQTQYVPGQKPVYPQKLKALEGKQVCVVGVVFSIKSLVQNEKLTGALLMPPAKIDCCGTACANDPRTMVFVSCDKSPIAVPAGVTNGKFAAKVTGRLSLAADDSAWGLFTLEDAQVVP
jgi:hypothetical protein